MVALSSLQIGRGLRLGTPRFLGKIRVRFRGKKRFRFLGLIRLRFLAKIRDSSGRHFLAERGT